MTIKDITITEGATFSLVVKCGTEPLIYKEVQAVQSVSPLVLTVPDHGCPENWVVAFTGFKRAVGINAGDLSNLVDSDFHPIVVLDANTIRVDDIDTRCFSSHIEGGYILYDTPLVITDYTASMVIKDVITSTNLLVCSTGGTSGTVKPTAAGTDGQVEWEAATSGITSKEWVASTTYQIGDVIDTHELVKLTTENSRLYIDAANHRVFVTISAADTSLMKWETGVYRLDIISNDIIPIVTEILRGTVTIDV